MRAARGLLTVLLLTATAVLAQSPLDSADDAYRRGDLKQAARLYGQAAEAESDTAQRAEIRVKQAWAFFGAKSRSKAEEALAAAARDNPALDLDAVYYTDEFVALFARVKARLAAPAPTPAPARSAPLSTSSLAGIRQRLAQAPDSAAVEPLLAELQQLELAVPPASLAELLEVKAEALERIGRVPEAFEQRGRAGALRTTAQAPPGTSPVPLDTLLEARRLMAAGRSVDATALLRGVLATLPSSGPALELLGEALVESGKLDEGVNALRTALLGNEKGETLLVLGEAEFRRGRLPAARESFRRATELDPSNDRALAALGLLAARAGDLAGARETLDRALQSNGALFEARVVRGELALLDGDSAAAQGHLQRALQLKPEDPWASGWLGMTEMADRNWAAAAEHLAPGARTALPMFAVAYAETLRRLKRIDEALATLASIAELPTTGVFVRARCLLDANRAAEAATILSEAVTRHADDTRVHVLLAAALHTQRDWPGAVRELSLAAAGKGAAPDLRDELARAQATLEAQALLDGAVAVTAPVK